ncbi:MAG TPA: hypothetical protein ENN22_06900 [bacterium]|nr:hypothetical protein [bacterium]
MGKYFNCKYILNFFGKPHLLVEFETAEAVYKLLFLFSYTMMNHGVYSNYIVEPTPQFIVVQGR